MAFMLHEVIPTKKQMLRDIRKEILETHPDKVSRIRCMFKEGYTPVDISRALQTPVYVVQYHGNLLNDILAV